MRGIIFAAFAALPLLGCIGGPPIPDPTLAYQPPAQAAAPQAQGGSRTCPALVVYSKGTEAEFAAEVAAIGKTAPTVVAFLGDYRGMRKACGAP